MKKILVLVVLFVLTLVGVSYAGGQKTISPDDGRWTLTIGLQDGRDCSTAKVRVSVIDNGRYVSTYTSCNAIVEVEIESPNGYVRTETIDIPTDVGDWDYNEKRYINGQSIERVICMDSPKEGRGTVRILVNGSELVQTDLRFRDGYISFGYMGR